MTSIVFMGTPSFAVPILQELINHNYEIKKVVTQPDRPVGRKRILTASPVKEEAQKHQIDVLQPEKINGSEEMEEIISLEPDFIVTAAYGQFLPDKLLNSAKFGAINVHGSLLPKYRGGAPVQYSIMNGEKETGITIMYMVNKMDAGDILAQKSIPITIDDDTSTMFEKLSLIGSDLLIDVLPKLLRQEIMPKKQDETKVVFSPNIKPGEEKLDIKQSAFLINAKIRALRPNPGAYLTMNGKRTKIWDTKLTELKSENEPGTVYDKTKHSLKIVTGNNDVLEILSLQPSGKPKQKITDYLNGVGNNIKIGEQVIE
ncbi:methionyl-tRNA formyltransferase [Lactobacillus sp. S2-2]|uniref:methionyl-tRNA formyltransferase n=1 Tax=Lactobacillus sp. S2-2 TaxID=2692917 RepID=UPI001F00B442|nr:methionyl-tRNA formyltransferase [Lactobacillus sp. S2-2]MCF6515099.1 methionyl-tRNA formyltransferase [Lactobacillus sp. S2-2]